MNLTGIKLKK